MRTTYITYIILAVLALAVFNSCKSKKGIAEGIDAAASVGENDAQFQSLFFDGQKEKAIENYDKAYQKFQECAQVNPAEDVIYYELARLDTLNGNFPSALGNITQAVGLDPNNLWYARLKADIQVETGALDEALKTLKSIALRDPEDIAYRDKLASLATYQKDYKTALSAYNEIEREVGLNEDLTRQKYYLFMDQGKSEEALNELTKLTEAFPNDISYLRNIAAHHQELGATDEAFVIYEKIGELNPNDGATQLALAEYYSANGDTAKSNKALLLGFSDEATPIEKKIKVLFTIIQSKDESVDVNELISTLQSVHPERGETWSISGDYAEMNNEPSKALDYFKQALSIDPNYKDLWVRVNQIAYNADDFSELSTLSQEALTYFPLEPDFYFYEGLSKLELGDSKGAINALSTGKDFILDDPAAENKFQVALGEAHFKAEEYQLAQNWLEQALTTGSVSSVSVIERLGDTAAQLGNTTTALEYWNQAKGLGGASEELDRKIADERYIAE
ncbi:MAG: tetratricopeptide repeat protein [Flavobacteriales bacterium]